MRPSEIARLKEPLCPEPDVRAYMLYTTFICCFAHTVLTDPYIAPPFTEVAYRSRTYASDVRRNGYSGQPSGQFAALGLY